MRLNDLLDYLPPLFYDIREFTAIFDAYLKQLNLFSENCKKALDNQFIQTADTEGIDRIAKSLKINLPGDMTASEKRFEVKTRLAEHRPYNEKSIRKMLSDLCGDDNFRLYIERSAHSVTVKLGLAGEYLTGSVFNLLDRIVPSNMSIEVAVYNTHGILQTAEKTHGELAEFTYEDIRTEAIT